MLPRGTDAIAVSGDSRIYVVAGPRQNKRLMQVFTDSEPIDLNDVVSGFDLSWPYRLRAAGSSSLLIGAQERWSVFDISSRRMIRAGTGRFPCLSPDAEQLAYVVDNRLVVGPVEGKHESLSVGNRAIHGIGSWSPDGRWLLVGATVDPFMVVPVRLLAVEVSTARFVDLLNIDPDTGVNSLWINRSLVDAA